MSTAEVEVVHGGDTCLSDIVVKIGSTMSGSLL